MNQMEPFLMKPKVDFCFKELMEDEAWEKAVRDYNTVVDSSWKSGHEEGMKEGIEHGVKALIETCQEFHLPKSEVSLRIMQQFSLSPKEADIYVEKYWKE